MILFAGADAGISGILKGVMTPEQAVQLIDELWFIGVMLGFGVLFFGIFVALFLKANWPLD